MDLRTSGLLAALLAATLAGCLTSPGAPPAEPGPFLATTQARLHCLGGGGNGTEPVCNFESTVDPETRQANELSIAVNPLDPDNIIATGKDYTPEYAGQCVWDGLYATHDGGLTWTNQNVPGSPWKAMSDPSSVTTPPPETSKFFCATDPVVAFGPDGTAYWTVMPYQCDPVSGSRTGRELVPGTGIGLPQGGFNDWFWTCSAMYVLVSHDGGLTWPVADMREVAFGPRLEHDKQWLSVAPNGNVLLCWDRSPAAPDPTGQLPIVPGAGNFGVVCAVSTDKGNSWSDFQYMTYVAALPWVDYGPDNTAYAALIDDAHVLVGKSADGLAWEPLVAVGPYENPPPGGEYGWPVLRGSDFRTFAVPSIAVDRSNGTYAGSIYVAWFDHSRDEGDVLLSYSRDGGNNWSAPRIVHDDDPALKADQFMPAVSVGPDGTVDVLWLDRRDDPANHLFTPYYTYSLDGGRSFAKNLRVGTELSDEQYSHHQNGMVFLGDYIDLDSSAGMAHAVWPDTRNQVADAFVATIERPGANPAAPQR